MWGQRRFDLRKIQREPVRGLSGLKIIAEKSWQLKFNSLRKPTCKRKRIDSTKLYSDPHKCYSMHTTHHAHTQASMHAHTHTHTRTTPPAPLPPLPPSSSIKFLKERKL